MVEPDPGSASTASQTVEERDRLTTIRKGNASMAWTNPGSASVASHTVKEQKRSLDVTSIGSSEPRRPVKQPTRTDDTNCDRPAKALQPRSNSLASFHSNAATARKARLRFEAATRGATPSAAEKVRSRVVNPGTRDQPTPGESSALTDGDQPTSSSRRGDERNAGRLKLADKTDRETLGESLNITSPHALGPLPSDASLFFPDPVVGPCDEFVPPPWFLEGIRRICATDSPTPTKSPIRFELSDQAAEHNAAVLGRFGFDVGRLIRDNNSSTLGFGSEFRGVNELEPLLGKHPHFSRLTELLTEGMPYVFNRELTSAERRKEVLAMLARGNHKSAQSEQFQVGKLLEKDVLHGFAIPIPISVVSRIPGAMVQPLGLAQQWTVNPEGKRVIKFRLTQDLSFSTNRAAKPTSVNARVDMSAYVEMIYGWCLPRIIHYVVSLRAKYPGLRILISKYDYSDAYRRIAHSPEAAAQTIAINGNMAYLSLRLTYGGSPNPPTWCTFSELVTDLANEIGQCAEWDPETLRSPAQPDTPEPIRLPESVPMVQARRMAVVLPMSKAGGRVDGFIDDLINVFADTPENCRRQPHVVPLAMHVTSRPHAGEAHEPVPRRPILSQPKLMAEGRPEEVQIVLGWRIDTRRLEISLPDDKYKTWAGDVHQLIRDGHCGVKELETLVGRLNHTSYIMPNARHFMSRIRQGLESKSKSRRKKVNAAAIDDLHLWLGFLAHAHRGVPMNLLVTREPNKVCWSDACPLGIGGYSLSGRAWRLRIPENSPIHGHKGINNLLEFLGMSINIWLSCLESKGDESCILAIGDNTSAIGWLHNSSRLDIEWAAHSAHLLVARKIATLLTEHNCCLASQHLKGDLNVVADLLSFEGSDRGKDHPIAFDKPANDELTSRFLTHYPSQIPANFAISQLPTEILSWSMQVLQVAESYLTADRRAATKPTTVPGGGGKDIVDTWVTQLTLTSLSYPTTNGTFSSGPSSTSTDKQHGTQMADLRELVASQWSQVLCGKPQATWLRRFGTVSGSAPCTSRDQRTCDPSSDPGCKLARTSTHQNDNNAR